MSGDEGDGGVVEIHQHFECTATTSFDTEFCSVFASDLPNANQGSFWTSTGLYPQHIKLESVHAVPKYVVSGFSADLWQVKELRLRVFGADRTELYSTAFHVDPPGRDGAVDFTSKHAAIPTADAAAHVTLEILSGYSDFCAVRKVRLLGKKTNSGQPSRDEAERTSGHGASDSNDEVDDEAQAYAAANAVNQGQRAGGTTVVAAVYGAGNSKTVKGNHTIVVPRGRKKKR